MSQWTDERVTDLKRMHAGGMSAGEIATALGAGFTRNAVIGKIHRLNLAGRAKPGNSLRTRQRHASAARTKRAKANERSLANKIKAGTFGKPAVPKATPPRPRPIEDMAEPPTMRIPLLGLDGSMCRWPIGDPRDADFGFCGHRQFGERSYCEYHARLAYVPITPRQNRQDGRLERLA